MKVSCIGCGLNCKNLSDNNHYRVPCDAKKLVVWPDTNYYFRLAVHEIFFEMSYYCFNDGVIVVDFSRNYISYYLYEYWLKKLEITGLKIVLVAESSMLALANYWLTQSEYIWTIIETDDDINVFTLKFRRLLKGRRSTGRKSPVLSTKEIITLKMLFEGCSTKEIARTLGCDTRNVYNFRYSLRRKIGGLNSLRDFFYLQ